MLEILCFSVILYACQADFFLSTFAPAVPLLEMPEIVFPWNFALLCHSSLSSKLPQHRDLPCPAHTKQYLLSFLHHSALFSLKHLLPTGVICYVSFLAHYLLSFSPQKVTLTEQEFSLPWSCSLYSIQNNSWP